MVFVCICEQKMLQFKLYKYYFISALDAALDRCSWDLAKELVRFLRTIDPEEVEEASQRPLAAINPTSPPMNPSAPEEEISLLLGTLQVPRGRSTSVTHGQAKVSPKDALNHKDLSRSNSETKAPNYRYVQ